MFCSDCEVAVETSKEVLPTLSWYLLEQFQHQEGHRERNVHACTSIGYIHACTYICVHAFLKPTEYRLHTHQLYIHTSFPPLLIFITHGLCDPRTFLYRYIMYTKHKPLSPLLCTPLYTLMPTSMLACTNTLVHMCTSPSMRPS